MDGEVGSGTKSLTDHRECQGSVFNFSNMVMRYKLEPGVLVPNQVVRTNRLLKRKKK